MRDTWPAAEGRGRSVTHASRDAMSKEHTSFDQRRRSDELVDHSAARDRGVIVEPGLTSLVVRGSAHGSLNKTKREGTYLGSQP